MQTFFIVNKASIIPEILVYGYIGDDDVNAGDFIKELRSLEKDHAKINVRINSGGGSVFEGIAIYNAMKNSKAEINTYIDGIAASMGSVIALGGKKCYMSKNARMMTHKASGLAIGGAESMRQTATLIESLEETIATIYANKSGLTQADAKAKFLKQEDNWMTAEQAMQEKLVDGIFDATASVDVPATAKTDKEVWKIYNTIFHTNNNNMKQIFLTAEQLGKINLKADTADATAFAIAFDNLVAEAAKVPQLTNELTAAKTAKKTAEDALENLKSSQDTATIENLIAGGVKDKKFTVEVGNQLKAAYAGNPTGLKSLVDAMPVYTGIVASIGVGVNADRIKELSAKTWDEMDKSGELTELKAIAFDVFKDKYKTTFKKDFE